MNYSEVLLRRNVRYTERGLYLFKGTPTREQGWLLHISCIQLGFCELLENLVPILEESEMPYKVVRDIDVHCDINSGRLGVYKYGKVITVYIENEGIAGEVISRLNNVTSGFVGPKVVTDFKVGPNLYVRYGGFYPFIEPDSSGMMHRMIMDGMGRLIRDSYRIPPSLPSGIKMDFLKEQIYSENKVIPNPLKGKYALERLIISNIRCMEWRGTYEGVGGGTEHCLVTRVKAGAVPDRFGGDMMHRLRWNRSKSLEISEFRPMPKELEYWEDEGQAFWIRQFKWRNLQDVILAALQRSVWMDLSPDMQLLILEFLGKVASLLKDINGRGYVLGNLSLSNFGVLDNGEIFPISLESCYSTLPYVSLAPFEMKREDYMSFLGYFEQAVELDDIYAFGWLAVAIFTGFKPYRLSRVGAEEVSDKLRYVMGSQELVEGICLCLDKSPENRPSWDKVLNLIRSEKQCSHPRELLKKHISEDCIKLAINEGLTYLMSGKMGSIGKWYSHVDNFYDEEVYLLDGKRTLGGLFKGAGGILYLLLKITKIGLEVPRIDEGISCAIDFLRANAWDNKDNENVEPASGMYYGMAGQLVLINLIESTMIGRSFGFDRARILTEISMTVNSVSGLFHGIAGEGIALLQCLGGEDFLRIEKLLESIASRLVNMQELDGSWKMKDKEKEIVILPGLSEGVSGIVYFLMEYGIRQKKEFAINAAKRGLDFLYDLVRDPEHKWSDDNIKAKGDIWLENGSAGIALVFLKAYELLNSSSYVKIAETILDRIPARLIYRNFSFSHGICGVGEVYLEALRLTGDLKWRDRAAWLAGLFAVLKFSEANNGCYWIVDKRQFPTADLATGSCGILHFLIRFLFPNDFYFPVLLEPASK